MAGSWRDLLEMQGLWWSAGATVPIEAPSTRTLSVESDRTLTLKRIKELDVSGDRTLQVK
jgi:hypothetical protein